MMSSGLKYQDKKVNRKKKQYSIVGFAEVLRTISCKYNPMQCYKDQHGKAVKKSKYGFPYDLQETDFLNKTRYC